MSLVDVIIPFYNTRITYMRDAVKSVLAQTFPDWTAYIVNDGSRPDSTRELEALLAELNDPRLVYIQQENRGLSGARNSAIRAGRSEFLAVLDSDDLWHPHKLTTQLPVLQEHAAVTATVASTDDILDGVVIPYLPGRRRWLEQLSPEELFIQMTRGNVIPVNTVICRRVDAERAGLFDEQFHCLEDKEFWMRLMLGGARFHFADVSLGIYRKHSESLSRNVEKMRRGRVQLVEKLDRLVPQRPADWHHLNWAHARQRMLRHAYCEAAEEALDGGDYRTAIRYSLPRYSGLSRRAGLLALRGVYRLAHASVAPTK